MEIIKIAIGIAILAFIFGLLLGMLIKWSEDI